MSSMSSLPNVIYILSDDQRAEQLGCAGHGVVETPELDRLAREGVYFPNTFCTSPACTPSRTSHYLGQWERRHGINFNSGTCLRPEAWAASFPMHLKRLGYYLGWVGKNHVPVGERGYLSGHLEEMFDYWYGHHGHSGFYPKETTTDGLGHIFENTSQDTQAEVFTEGALRFLDPEHTLLQHADPPLPMRPPDRPFCLCLTFNLPHTYGVDTMQLRPTDDELYKSGYRDRQHQLKPHATYLPHGPAYESPRLPRSLYNNHRIPSYDFVKRPETLREYQVRSCQTITGMDRAVGAIHRTLARLGLADNTIIVFSSDHGQHFGEHGLGGKCFLYEESLRIPLIIHDPRLPAAQRGQRREEMVVVPDLAPTVLDLVGAESPASMQGRSLRPLMHGEPVAWREDFFAEQLMDIQNYPRSECLRTAEWKYIRYFPRTEDPAQAHKEFKGTLDRYDACLFSSLRDEQPVYEELFCLRDDPHECENLARDPAQRDRLREMRQAIVRRGWEARQDDQPPLTCPVRD